MTSPDDIIMEVADLSFALSRFKFSELRNVEELILQLKQDLDNYNNKHVLENICGTYYDQNRRLRLNCTIEHNTIDVWTCRCRLTSCNCEELNQKVLCYKKLIEFFERQAIILTMPLEDRPRPL